MDDSSELVRRQFGANAERYVTSGDHSKGESLDRMLALARPQPDWRVLDIATGGGHTALAFAPHVREVVASDITPEMLDAAERFIRSRGISNVRFAEADATSLPFPDGDFHLVTCRVAPHHFPDCAGFVREMARVLRPGGAAIMVDNVVPSDRSASDFINAFEKRRDPSHQRAYTAQEWRDFFARAGFRIETEETFRKARQFDHWLDIQGVSANVKAELKRMLEEASGESAKSLAPETRDGKLYFYLTEILLMGRRLA